MIKQSLWAEFIIGGFLYVLDLIIVILLWLGIYDFHFIEKVKDFWPVLSIVFVMSSYIFGFIIHRSISLLFSKKSDPPNHDNTVILLQYGTESLIENTLHQYRLIVTSRLLIFGLIFLSILLPIWLSNTELKNISILIAIIIISLGILSIFITYKQKKDYKDLFAAAIKEIKSKNNNFHSNNEN